MIKAIFFDFNGVIIDDETIQMKAYQEVLAARGTLKEEWFSTLGWMTRHRSAMFERAKNLYCPLESSAGRQTDCPAMIEDEFLSFPACSHSQATSRHFQLGL